MAQLVSPGLSITVIDEGQYVPAGNATVPLVLLATQQDKTNPSGSIASGTIKDNAGKLQNFGSQRELITAMGYPFFKTVAGTPQHGYELNEYGLQAAYSAMGLGNQVYAIRADIDTKQLEPSGVRPTGSVPDGTLWLDTANTNFGIFDWNASTQAFSSVTPLVLVSSSDIVNGSPTATPKASVGTIGSYAVIAIDQNNPVFYKNAANTWVPVGTAAWQKSLPTVQSSFASYVGVPDGSTIVINTIYSITLNATDGITCTLNDVKTSINNAVGGSSFANGIQAGDVNGRLVIYATSASASNGSTADGIVKIGASDGADSLGLNVTAGSLNFYAPLYTFGSYTQVPTYAATDATPAPTGSVWFKTSSVGQGANWVIQNYSDTAGKFVSLSTPVYASNQDALYGLDVYNGGFGIAKGSVYIDYNTITSQPATFRVKERYKTGVTKITGAVPSGSMTAGDAFQIIVTEPGVAALSTPVTVTIGSDVSMDALVANILSKGIKNLSAQKEATGALTLQHKTGGDIILKNTNNTPLTDAGIVSNNSALYVETAGTYAGSFVVSNWRPLVLNTQEMDYKVSSTQPYTAPADGTYWYFNDVVEADVLINDGTGWRGYRNGGTDARGYTLASTDTNGPIFSASTPISQSTGNPLQKGDLWVNTGNMEHFPDIRRYNGSTFVAIDKTDRFTINGIVFADARWDASVDGNGYSVGGIIDPVVGSLPVISTMLTSDYVDLDCPDYRLYPRGTILWNTRRNGGNIKQYVSGAFTTATYPDAGQLTNNQAGNIPAQSATWVTASGLMDDGTPYMGHKAQRHMVVKALRAALDSNTDIREEQYQFNLIVAPGYPELFVNMVALNNDRTNTAFIIGDTPLDLKPNSIDITNYSNNVATTADVYGALYYPAGLSSDLSGNDIVVPASHMALRTFIHSDNISYPWFAPAGARRGLVDNATAVGYLDYATGEFYKIGVNQSLRDNLYTNRINPIANLPGLGLVIFGNKTRSPIPQATDRVNVSRLVNYIRTILAKVGNSFLFEPNDKITRDQIKQVIEGAINDLVAKRGIYDYLVVCDSSNNTNARIARNELYVDIAIEPMKDVEFIYIPIRLKNPGAIAAGGK